MNPRETDLGILSCFAAFFGGLCAIFSLLAFGFVIMEAPKRVRTVLLIAFLALAAVSEVLSWRNIRSAHQRKSFYGWNAGGALLGLLCAATVVMSQHTD